MLEVDEDSRLGSELLAGGSRYHAHYVPDDDLTADLYLPACERLEHGGVQQYEISNFARPVTHGYRIAGLAPQPQILDPPTLSRIRSRCSFHAAGRARVGIERGERGTSRDS